MMNPLERVESGIINFKNAHVIKGLCLLVLFLFSNLLSSQNLKLHDGYYKSQGLDVLVFNNEYNGQFFDEKTAGIELIHHGVRTVTGGAIRLHNTPEQWDLIPKMLSRTVDSSNNTIEVVLRYEDYDFNSILLVQPKAKGFEITVRLDQPLPKALEGRAGFNMEFLPSIYFESNYLVDGSPATFPKYPSSNTVMASSKNKIPQFEGHNTFDDRGENDYIIPQAIATGSSIIMAPENPETRIKIESDQTLQLFDGRLLAQNGWFVVRSVLPAGKTGNVLSWYVEANTINDWLREPVIGFSQVGYLPNQEKIAVIELDKNDDPLPEASVFKLDDTGEFIEVRKLDLKFWGTYLRYQYTKADFSAIKDVGIYYIQYGTFKTNTFQITNEIYKDVWQPTMDVFFPIQMDHMEVNEAYRTWHGRPFLDDCLQAPLNQTHFDGYTQGSTTDTKYKPLERIPNMSVGGWFDAGDFDIQTYRHVRVVSSFVDAWENFRIDRDETFIDQETQYVDMHRPDGQPDLLQQIEHGVLNLVAQVENIGHPVRGIVVPNLHQYHHLGDASTETDNLPYNPNLKPYESDGLSSGTMDDRWAFTNRSSFLDYSTAGSLAAASRALKGYNDSLSEKCLNLAKKLFNEANELAKTAEPDTSAMSRWGRGSDVLAMLQLFITTKEAAYRDSFSKQIWTLLDEDAQRHMDTALLAIPYMGEDYKAKLKNYVETYIVLTDKEVSDNPYEVPIAKRSWGGSSQVINWAITNYTIYKTYPDLMDIKKVFRGLNYIFGCHPYSNVSFVNAVGNKTKKVAYGSNRADFTTIAGGVVPGLIFLNPDFLENKDDWPFFWGENECIIDGGAWYVYLVHAANELSKEL